MGVYNQWVVDSLVEGDVIVADMFDKIYKGTFLGGESYDCHCRQNENRRCRHLGRHRDIEQMKRIDEDSGLLPVELIPHPSATLQWLASIRPPVLEKRSACRGNVVYRKRLRRAVYSQSPLWKERLTARAKAHIKDIFRV